MGIGIEIIPFNIFLSCNFCVYIRNDFRSLKCEIAIYPHSHSCVELRKCLNNRFGLSQIIFRHNPFEPSVEIQEKIYADYMICNQNREHHLLTDARIVDCIKRNYYAKYSINVLSIVRSI